MVIVIIIYIINDQVPAQVPVEYNELVSLMRRRRDY